MQYNTQQLLFDQSPLVLNEQVGEIQHDFTSFMQNGFVSVHDLNTVEDALTVINQLVHVIKRENISPWQEMIDRIQLSKLDMIPDCGDSVDASCQALHFDLGHPFAGEGHNVYGLVGLYMPSNSESAQTAQTRIVYLPELLKQQSSVSKQEAEQRLLDYVQNFGDGWKAQPEQGVQEYHSSRLACFARVVDAVHGRNQLEGDYDKTMAQWFSNGPQGPDICAEEVFYRQLGYDVSKVEQFVRLKPGQLLIVDNLRCIHGRVGERDMSEIAQILYGVKSSTTAHTNHYREWLISQFA